MRGHGGRLRSREEIKDLIDKEKQSDFEVLAYKAYLQGIEDGLRISEERRKEVREELAKIKYRLK